MDPLSALSVASAVIQIVDFSAKVIATSKEVYDSPDGATEQTLLLESATANLDELMQELGKSCRMIGDFSPNSPDGRLLQLAKESNEVATSIHEAIDNVRRKKDGGERTAFGQGLRSVLDQKKISLLTERLNQIRKQVDTTLLISLRQQIGTMMSAKQMPDQNVERPKTQLLASLRERNWKPSEQNDLTEFSEYLMSSVDMDVEDRFFNMMLGRLYFSGLPDRFESISEAHQETFQWMFESNPQHYNPDDWDNFTAWLSDMSGDNLFWATGKPGSGKSTLMKFLFNDSRTWKNLQRWSNGRPLVKAGFFFWNSGTVMQMSRMGLLQSILHTTLSNDKQTLKQLFKHRWQQFVAFGGGRQPVTWPELLRAFKTMVSEPETPRSFFFMIDGLDEFDGDSKELVDLVLDTSKHSHVKVCVASRPLLVFSDAFEERSSLRLERLTRNDIRKYVASHFANNKHYARLSKLEPDGALILVNDIVDKAAGVFLWVHLVVQSLLDGLSNADRMSDLTARLAALPPSLEDLYDRLLGSLDANYFRHACQLFRLVVHRPRVLLLELYFADNEDCNSAMTVQVKALSRDQIVHRLEVMQRRLTSRCKGFLEVTDWHSKPDPVLSEESVVGWIHRTARDFMRSKPMWDKVLTSTGHDTFDPDRYWANGFMEILKSIKGPRIDKWSDLMWCVEYALRIEERWHICPVEYLDEVDLAAKVTCSFYRDGIFAIRTTSITGTRRTLRVQNFLDFAVWASLPGYVRIKTRKMTHAELLHAAQFKDSPDGIEREPGSNMCKHMIVKRLELTGDREGSFRLELEQVLDSAIRSKKKEERKNKWSKAKKRVFG